MGRFPASSHSGLTGVPRSHRCHLQGGDCNIWANQRVIPGPWARAENSTHSTAYLSNQEGIQLCKALQSKTEAKGKKVVNSRSKWKWPSVKTERAACDWTSIEGNMDNFEPRRRISGIGTHDLDCPPDLRLLRPNLDPVGQLWPKYADVPVETSIGRTEQPCGCFGSPL